MLNGIGLSSKSTAEKLNKNKGNYLGIKNNVLGMMTSISLTNNFWCEGGNCWCFNGEH